MEDRAKRLADLKKLTLENQKLMKETLTLTRKNQTSLEMNAELQLAKLQADNQKLSEELLLLTERNNTLLEMQSELYKKVIEVKKTSKEAIFWSKSIDTNVKLGEKETWAGRDSRDGVEKRFRKVKSKEDQSFEDRRERNDVYYTIT